MKKQFLLAAVALSLFLLGYGILWPGGLAAMPMPLETPTLTGTPSPVPTLTLDKAVGEIVTDLDEDGIIDPGDTIRYTIAYENTGDVDATYVEIVDDYDQSLIVSTTNISGEGNDDGDTIIWNLGTVRPGPSDSVTYDATLNSNFPTGATDVTNKATISSAETAPATSTKTLTVERRGLTIDKGVAAALVKDSDGDGVVDPGDAIRYTVAYENSGDGEATNVRIVDDYDKTLIVSTTNISGEGKDDGDTIAWDLGTLEAGAGGSVTYEAVLKETFPPGSINIENTATIASDEWGLVSVTNAILVKGPNLTLLKGKELVEDLDGDGIVDPGDTIRYTIAYENTGEVEATRVTIVDDYDQNCIVSTTNISGEGKDDGDTIAWDLGTLEAGARSSVTYEGILGSLPVGASNVVNIATISSAEMDAVSTEASILVEVAPTPTPEPILEAEEGPLTGIFAGGLLALIPAMLTGILAIAAMVVLAYVGAVAKYGPGGEKGELSRERIALVREGVFLIFIVSAILILAIGGGIEPDGAISILSAIVGYVFGRTTGRREGGG